MIKTVLVPVERTPFSKWIKAIKKRETPSKKNTSIKSIKYSNYIKKK